MASLLGELKQWNDDKGYGFIRPGGGGSDVFVHVKDFPFYQRRPKEGDSIRYSEESDEEGRPRAASPKIQGSRSSTGAVILTALWLLSFAGAAAILSGVASGSLATYVVTFYLFGSTVTFTAYVWDKHRAVTDGSRVSENALHLLELGGGWPGGFAAQRIFRHKNRKISFQIVFWLIVAAHLGAWALFVTRG